ncbi:hypothetical protein HRbin36_01803 [bacterium HR36]|nr:hypothetical protein HRbin36_01803 [bacterium HR36]
MLGGIFFPTVFSYARFAVKETPDCYEITITSRQGPTLELAAKRVSSWPGDSAFESLEEASAFFERGAVGYSPGTRPGQYYGVELQCQRWQVEPLQIVRLACTFFDKMAHGSAATITPDCALVMRQIAHTWERVPALCCSGLGRQEWTDRVRT